MKRPYECPKMEYVTIRSRETVADVCWAFAKNGKTFYHDTPGIGYAILRLSGKSCDSGSVLQVELTNKDNMTSAQIAAAEAYIYETVQKELATAGGNSAEPFKGSSFTKSPDNDWS